MPTLGDALLTNLQPRHIREWHWSLTSGHLSDVSVAKVYRLLRSILSTAVQDGYLQNNPCQLTGAGIERSVERPIPTLEDVAKVSQAMPAHLATVPWVAALAGLRKGEILGLARRHVDLERGTIHVERALQELPGEGVVFAAPKTTRSTRTVTIPPRLVELLTGHLSSYVDDDPEALLFTNRYGRPIRATAWSGAWERARVEADLPRLRLHDLRHLAGTLTAQAGAALKETMDRLGHSSIDAAMRYQHVADERAQEVAKRIEDLL